MIIFPSLKITQSIQISENLEESGNYMINKHYDLNICTFIVIMMNNFCAKIFIFKIKIILV